MRGSPDFTKEGGMLVKYRGWIIGLVIIALLAASLFYAWQERKTLESGIRIHVVDVGQGDCMIIETSDGHVMIDTGANVSESSLRGYLRGHDLERMSYLILSHPHNDHIGNADMLLNEFTVERLVCAESAIAEDTYNDMKIALDTAMLQGRTEWIKPEAGNVYWVGKLRIEILHVPPTDNNGENEDSMIVRLDYGACSVLLTGDAENESEEYLLANIPSEKLSADLLKIAHHGSSSSSSEAFLQAVSPRIAAISAGEGNTFGHPHMEVLARLRAMNVEIYRTDTNGSLIFYCDGQHISVQKYDADHIT